MRLRILPILSLALILPAAAAQTVDYPDSTLNSPQGQYPVYTPTNGNTVRGQLYCPANFSGLPTVKCIVSRIGIQIAGQEDYTTFVVRAGTTSVTALTTSWSTNLPDQRVQEDLSGTKLPGGLNGTTQVNQWVEFEIDYPFLFTPGDALVVDITAKSKVAGTYCRSAIGTGVPRALDLAYTSTSTGPTTLSTSGGIKLRFVFQPIQYVPFGDGCPGTGNSKPVLAMTGAMNLGQVVVVNLSKGLGGATTVFFLGLSPLPMPLPIGGGCTLLTPLDWISPRVASGSGAGNGTSTQAVLIPNDKTLLGGVVNTQWCQLDNGSAALIPFTLSNGGKIVIN
ncbi:MAG: hypothetical protein R3F30_11555 [Planctomycetota bacterium]